ncbi:hypothetical protein Q9Q99_04285 [Curtobacterium flaccumfaciens]|nr:hypothetical protein Q9Q99_04285 [Curtobacterium flaccumfaciens]
MPFGGNGSWVTGAAFGSTVSVTVVACADGTSNFCGDGSTVGGLRPVQTRATLPESVTAGTQLTVAAPPQNAGLQPTGYRVVFCASRYFQLCGQGTVYTPDALPKVENAPLSRYVYVAAIVDGHEDPNPPSATITDAPDPEPTPAQPAPGG